MAEINWSLGQTPDFSSGIRYAEAGQANRHQQAELQRQEAQRRALSAYARDPQAGLAGVIETDPRLGIALQDQQLQNAAAQRQTQLAEEKRSYEARISLAKALANSPKGADRAALATSLAPFIPGVKREDLDALLPRLDDDTFLSSLAGEYTKKLNFMNLGEGYGVAVDERTGQKVAEYQAPRRVTLGEGQTLVELPGNGVGGAPSGPAPSATDIRGTIERLVPGVRFTSGQRTPERNAQVGGAPNSYHLSGNAWDIVPPQGMTTAQLRQTLAASGIPAAELLDEGDHVHVAWRGGQAQPSGARVVAQGAPKPEMTAYQREQLARQDKTDARQGDIQARQVRGEVARIRGTFNNLPEVKAFNDVTSAYGIVKDLGARQKPTAADDISMVFSYMKMLDPGSAVREGEFANAQNAAGIPDRVRNLYNRAMSGNLLNPKQRQEFTQSAETIYRARRPEYDRLVGEYQGYAEAAGGTKADIQARPAPTAKRGPGVSFQPNQQQAAALRGFNGKGPRGAATNPIILNPQDPNSSFGNVKPGQYFIGPDGQTRKKP